MRESGERDGAAAVTSRRGIAQALAAAVGTITFLLAACAHERPPRRIVESHQVPLPACPSALPPLPEQAAREGLYGVVLASYSIAPDGRVEDIELEDPRASPVLFEAVRSWLQRCRAPEPATSRRIVELFSFPPPQVTASTDEAPVPLEDSSARATRPVRSDKCSPDRPPPLIPTKGKMKVEYVVHSNGRVGDVLRRGGDAPAALLRGIRIWLQSCDYAPGMRDGKPVAMSVVEEFAFSSE